MKAPKLTPEQVEELIQKAGGIFQTIVALTNSPYEGVEVICMVHLLMYLNFGDGNTAIDDMLAVYCKNFRENFEAQKLNKSGLN